MGRLVHTDERHCLREQRLPTSTLSVHTLHLQTYRHACIPHVQSFLKFLKGEDSENEDRDRVMCPYWEEEHIRILVTPSSVSGDTDCHLSLSTRQECA